jgi:hypothetical protein
MSVTMANEARCEEFRQQFLRFDFLWKTDLQATLKVGGIWGAGMQASCRAPGIWPAPAPGHGAVRAGLPLPALAP